MQEKEKAPEQVECGGKLREETESEEAYARYTSPFSKAYAKRIHSLPSAGVKVVHHHSQPPVELTTLH